MLNILSPHLCQHNSNMSKNPVHSKNPGCPSLPRPDPQRQVFFVGVAVQGCDNESTHPGILFVPATTARLCLGPKARSIAAWGIAPDACATQIPRAEGPSHRSHTVIPRPSTAKIW